MSVPDRPSIYDRLRRHLEPLDLIQRLGLEVTRKLGSEAYLNPLCHESSGGESLQVNLHTGSWNCKACQSAGMRGDLFHLVEYVQTGGRAPSKGDGTTPERTEALRWLCDQFGEPFNEGRDADEDEALIGLETFVLAAATYLLERPDVLEWIERKWGFDLDTVIAYRIGFMPQPLLPEIALDASANMVRYRSAGLGWYDAGKFKTRFEGRITFPYLEHGRPVYLIGRATPWTPKIPVEGRPPVSPPKYHKLSVHSATRTYVSPAITNEHLFNEPVLKTCGAEIGVLEGIADGVAFSHIGIDVVSPVTISFNGPDLERFVAQCHENGIKVVWILFDNELSGSGNFAAIRAGRQLVEGGLDTRVVTLPPGAAQLAARQEVLTVIGEESLRELEACDPHLRKKLLAAKIPDEAQREWVVQNINAAKIDGAEWVAAMGAGAAEAFRKLRQQAQSVIRILCDEIVATLDPADEPFLRQTAFADVIELAAHLDVRQHRADAAVLIAELAGKGVTKRGDIEPAIAEARRSVVMPKRKKQEEDAEQETKKQIAASLIAPAPLAPEPPKPPAPDASGPPSAPARPGAPAAPKLPGKGGTDQREALEGTRANVAKAVDARLPDEHVGKFVAEVFKRTLGYMPFVTPEGVILVRRNERVTVSTDRGEPFRERLYEVSGLTPKKSSHGGYIAATEFHLAQGAVRCSDVAWSHVAEDRSVFFPLGDVAGRLLRIAPGSVNVTRMSDARVPAVAGPEFLPFRYVEDRGGVGRVYDLFRWTSLPEQHRLVLIYWLVCVPILRRVGEIPILRIEGGSASGKTRTVDAIGQLVNGAKGSSVPTAAALISRLSREMLTIDDNRETDDVSRQFLGTLLQASQLGAREKRRGNTDTGTIVERVCGALVMNGIEPIHDGKPELASRILPLRCGSEYVSTDSPSANRVLMHALTECRDRFWSESARLCATAMQLDEEHGEHVGKQIEDVFGATKIGRMSTYLRMMYLAWVSSMDEASRPPFLRELAPMWVEALDSIGQVALASLISEELCVSVARYVFDHGAATAEKDPDEPEFRKALGGQYMQDPAGGIEVLGPLRATTLARLARSAAKALNGPDAIQRYLRAGQLEERLLDGMAYLEAAGFEVEVTQTNKGRLRWTFSRALGFKVPTAAEPATGWKDSWQPN
tara:strand:+ start:3300 stop:6785 length:3486 start_codon:yes stop_codon:yes gene_type:complete